MEDILATTDRILRLRNYSPKTRKAYKHYIAEYLHFCEKQVLPYDQKSVEDFLLEKEALNKSSQTINLALNAIKFLFSEVLKNGKNIQRTD